MPPPTGISLVVASAPAALPPEDAAAPPPVAAGADPPEPPAPQAVIAPARPASPTPASTPRRVANRFSGARILAAATGRNREREIAQGHRHLALPKAEPDHPERSGPSPPPADLLA